VDSAVAEERMPNAGPPDDDNMSAGGCTPAYSASCAMDGISRAAEGGAFLIAPTWTGKDCTAGVWEHPTHGHGETDEVDEQDADHVPASVIRVISACSREIGVENGKKERRTIT
jgi:hypothetical protein